MVKNLLPAQRRSHQGSGYFLQWPWMCESTGYEGESIVLCEGLCRGHLKNLALLITFLSMDDLLLKKDDGIQIQSDIVSAIVKSGKKFRQVQHLLISQQLLP